MNVWIVTETYRYEDEHGGAPVEASARTDCERRREAEDRSMDFDYDVIEWEVAR